MGIKSGSKPPETEAQKDVEKRPPEDVQENTEIPPPQGVIADERAASALRDEQALENARRALEEASGSEPTYTLRLVGSPESLAERQAQDGEVLEGRSKEVPLESEKGRELVAALHDVRTICNALGAWKLDGAMNISLREIAKGSPSFYRNHRDIDAHVFGVGSGEKLSAILANVRSVAAPNGYGAFLRINEGGGIRYKKYNKGDLPKSGIQLFKLDQQGSPYIEITGVPIDVHFDAENPKSGITGTDLPQEWQKGGGKIAIGGVEVSLDHPGSVLYHKLMTGREHDYDDIAFMVAHGQVSTDDAHIVEQVLRADLQHAQHTDQQQKITRGIATLTSIVTP